MGKRVWVTLAALFVLGHPGSGQALESTLHLDGLTFIHETGADTEAIYRFPKGARVRVVFGKRSGDRIPATVPVDGLLLGVARAERMPPVTFRLAQPAKGSLQVGGPDAGTLDLDAAVLVQRPGGKPAPRLRRTIPASIAHHRDRSERRR